MNITNFFQNPLFRLFPSAFKIVSILGAALLFNYFLKIFIEKTVKEKIKSRISSQEKKKRVETIIGVFYGTFRFLVWIVALMMVLSELGIDTAPILASLGVAGLAVGMAARDIISDFITGLFIILEDQYHLGDWIRVAGLEGEVKEITLRRTIIQDKEGVFHSIPNSKINIVSKKEE